MNDDSNPLLIDPAHKVLIRAVLDQFPLAMAQIIEESKTSLQSEWWLGIPNGESRLHFRRDGHQIRVRLLTKAGRSVRQFGESLANMLTEMDEDGFVTRRERKTLVQKAMSPGVIQQVRLSTIDDWI